jgi:hypothetical protein
MERRGGFQKNQSVPHPVRALPNHLVDLLAIMLLIPYAGHEIHRVVGIGKTWNNRTDLVTQSVRCTLYRHHRAVANIAERSSSL